MWFHTALRDMSQCDELTKEGRLGQLHDIRITAGGPRDARYPICAQIRAFTALLSWPIGNQGRNSERNSGSINEVQSDDGWAEASEVSLNC
jgi:hypothetical protein